MKKQIRNEVFETNSSSCHALSINRENENTYNTSIIEYGIQEDNKVHIRFGEFGWGYDEYIDSWNKLKYALTMVMVTESAKVTCVDDFYDTEGFRAINDLISSMCHCDGIVIDSEIKMNFYYDTKWDEETNRWVEDKNVKRFYLNHDGYIDHQSCESYGSLQDFLDDYSITLEDFIFNPGITLIIDNDNH